MENAKNSSSTDVVKEVMLPLYTSGSDVVPTPNRNPIITPTDRDILFANEKGVWVCAMGANHFANRLLQDLILLHRIIGLLQNKENISVDALVWRLFSLMKHGKRYELAGLKGVSKALFTGSGRFLRLRRREETIKEEHETVQEHQQQQQQQEQGQGQEQEGNEKKRKIEEEGKESQKESQKESNNELQEEQGSESKEPERKKVKVEGKESEESNEYENGMTQGGNEGENTKGEQVKEDKLEFDSHHSPQQQPWEELTDNEAQDFLRSLIIRELEKTASVNDISVKEAFAEFLNTNSTRGTSTIQNEPPIEKASDSTFVASISNDIGQEKAEGNCEEGKQTIEEEFGDNNNINQNNNSSCITTATVTTTATATTTINTDGETKKKQREEECVIADGDKDKSMDEDKNDAKDKSSDQGQTKCDTTDVGEEKNSGGTEHKEMENVQESTNEGREEDAIDSNKGIINEQKDGGNIAGRNSDSTMDTDETGNKNDNDNKSGMDSSFDVGETKVENKENDNDSSKTQKYEANGSDVKSDKDEGCTAKTEIYYNQLILATSQDILLLPCDENVDARLGELPHVISSF